MKSFFLFTVALLLTATTWAANQVLIESETNIRFGPPGKAGVYRHQILADGTIQSLNNKNVATVYGKLTKAAVQSLVARIEETEAVEMQMVPTPACAPDKPSVRNFAYKTDGTVLGLKSKIGCKAGEMDGGRELNSLIEASQTMASYLK